MKKHRECPFCGNDDLQFVLVVNEQGEDWRKFVECKFCKARGPWVNPDYDPYRIWDHRFTDNQQRGGLVTEYADDTTIENLTYEQLGLLSRTRSELFVDFVKNMTKFDYNRVRIALEMGRRQAEEILSGGVVNNN